MMLVVTRRIDESVKIGDDVEIMVVGCKNKRVRIGIKAPKGVRIERQAPKTRRRRREVANVEN
jgi:carbon storage regulator